MTPTRISIAVCCTAALVIYLGYTAARMYEEWRERRDQLIKDKLARRYNMAAFQGTKERPR